MASKEQIAEMDNAERVEVLNKAIKKQVNKHFKGSNLQAEVTIKVSKCEKCDDDGRIPTHIKDSLNRMMKNGSGMGKLSGILLDEWEKAAIDHPALKNDKQKADQIKRMFEIRRELNALVDFEERAVDKLNGKIPFSDTETKEIVMGEVKRLDEAQRKLLDELQAL